MWEKGLFKTVIQNLSIRDYLGDNLKKYFGKNEEGWAYKFFFCEALYLVNAVCIFFFTDWFLGGQFLSYGSDVIQVAGMDPENRTDPMAFVFPRMAKCTFRSFGSSGTIQVRDVMCLIATNIINEKIYVYIWVWLVLLMTISSLWMLYRLLTIFLPFFRKFLLQIKIKVDLKPTVDSLVFRLHYRYTNRILLASTLLTTLYDVVGKKIDCITSVDSASFKDVVDNYCFIMGTFTVDRLHGKQVGVQVPHPGVGPSEPDDELTFHTYYQWVPFVLFAQVPSAVFVPPEPHGPAQALVLSVLLCEALNLGVVLSTLYFTDWFLDGGVPHVRDECDPGGRHGPREQDGPDGLRVPRMAKCTFRSFGSSGTIQIYLFLWVWLVTLTALTGPGSSTVSSLWSSRV
ncbi:innexin 3 [Penaeus vannamei]|uniref:Innexin n=1 Tax=Penaeus vannamei TaxID=6689 RepID=A0A3R7SXS0_PENVA|nr:innexin 3 [Penaeus vannamei]